MKPDMLRAPSLIAGLILLGGSLALGGEIVEYYHVDAIGNVRAVTNQAGQVVERHDYLPFGEECLTGPCASNPQVGAGQPRKFTGKERDAETGFDYFGARYYQAKWGRFTTIDPVYTWQENLADPQRWNRYAYARNNPLRYTDPDGKVIETAWDVVSLGLSIKAVRDDPRSVWNWVSLGADVLSVAAPVVPAVGMVIRGAGKVDDAIDAAKGTEKTMETSRAARREAMREQGIPTSQQPVPAGQQVGPRNTPQGKAYEYEVPREGGGTQRVGVQETRYPKPGDPHGPHWEAGRVKPGGQTDGLGRPRLQSDKSRVGYEE